MRLHTHPGAPNPRRVHIDLAEKGIGIPLRELNVMKGESRTPEFLASPFFSMADIVVFTAMDFAAQLNDLPHSADQAHLSRWHRAVSDRPSAKA